MLKVILDITTFMMYSMKNRFSFCYIMFATNFVLNLFDQKATQR